MITAHFTGSGGRLNAFSVSGHSGLFDYGQDIVCAAVSSAVMMAANTITEVMKLPARADVSNNTVSLSECREQRGCEVIEGLRLQLTSIAEDYPKAVKVIITMEE